MDTTLSYLVDAGGTITEIDGPWDQFAGESGTSPTRGKVLGSNLFDHLTGPEVRSIYHSMHAALLDRPGKRIVFPYRCDSPELRRHMRMNLTAEGSSIVYRSTVLREEPFPQPIALDYAADQATRELVLICAWCRDFRFPAEAMPWRPIEEAFAYLPAAYSLTHGICDSCMIHFLTELDTPGPVLAGPARP